MSEDDIQKILDGLQKYAIARRVSDSAGDPWGGYTRYGFEISYQATENNYRWDDIYDNGLSESITDSHIYTLEELKAALRKIEDPSLF